VYGRTGNEQPQPWSPISRDHQRANLHLYWLGTRGPDLVSYKKTDGEPIKVYISKVVQNTIIVVEQKVTARGAVSIEVATLELQNGALKRVNVTMVPLQTQVSCVEISPEEKFLTLGCIDASLALLDRDRGLSKIVKVMFIPSHIAWHDCEVLMAVANDTGQIQYYDTALTCVTSSTSNELNANILIDTSEYFQNQKRVDRIFWVHDSLFIVYDQGPMALIKSITNMTFKGILQMYIQTDKIQQAINLLLSREFDETTYKGLQMIVNYVLRQPINDTMGKYLQDALGSFHCPTMPLSPKIIHKYGSPVKSLTRRFFHQLVRNKMYETAFLLAVDLGHHDLFMDLHYVAVKIGETEMAAAARAQASALLSRCSSEASNCSRSSCSQCSSEDSETESSDTDHSEEHTTDKYSPSQTTDNSDNFLSTNFNTRVPKTYKPTTFPTPPIPVIDLPKIRLNVPVKPLQPPPLPTTSPPLPLTLGIPYVPRYSFDNRFVPFRSIYSQPSPMQPLPVRIRMRPPPPPVRLPPPPLPITTKPPRQKVKFSDTVTAFIVPEVKRTVKVNPPLHVTDPQKELADSLPLCHPNEEYLKDFTPMQKEEDEVPEAEDNGNAAPKIKVVHFGLV